MENIKWFSLRHKVPYLLANTTTFQIVERKQWVILNLFFLTLKKSERLNTLHLLSVTTRWRLHFKLHEYLQGGKRQIFLFTFMHWRRKWQPTPVFLPGESQGQGSLVGCRLWGRTESDTTEVTQQQQLQKELCLHYFMYIIATLGLPWWLRG